MHFTLKTNLATGSVVTIPSLSVVRWIEAPGTTFAFSMGFNRSLCNFETAFDPELS